MMRLFVSGPMRGLPDRNRAAFCEAETMLRLGGYQVTNPTRCQLPGASWQDAMRHHITSLMDCDALAYLPGWEDSEGACLEVGLMRDLGLPANSVSHWLAYDPWAEVERAG